MRVIIIEDELLAQAHLEHLLAKVQPDVIVEARLGSVKDTIAWLSSHDAPDLAFVDIQLSDDHSFAIFRNIAPVFPIVFTTAYDKYIMESFEYNSIDYLLKPITAEKLKRALNKVTRLSRHFVRQQLHGLVHPDEQGVAGKFVERIVARKGSHYVIVPADEVAYFFTLHKVVFVRDVHGKQFIVDKNLGALEPTLDPKKFIRLNRKYIAAATAVTKYTSVHGKLLVQLNPAAGEDVFVSKESAPAFRAWIGQRTRAGH